MKKFAFLFVTLLFSSLVSALPLRFEEGKHYQVISQQASAEPNVTEFFSFYCPHCYRFETIARDLEKNLPKNASFKKSHVDFMRSASPEIQQNLSRAMVVGEKMGLGHKVIDAIFKHIHADHKPFTSEDDVMAVFTALGADVTKAKKLFNSFEVKGKVGKMKKDQDDLSNARILDSVPTLIVNGKYKIIGKELRSKDDYQSLVEFLLSMK